MKRSNCIQSCIGIALFAIALSGCHRRTPYQPTPFQGVIAVDSAGNRVVAGSFRSRLGVGNNALSSTGGSDIFVAKIRRDGTNVWPPRAFGGAGDDGATGVMVDADGAIIVVGTFQGEISIGTTRLKADAKGPNERGVFVVKLDGDDARVIWATSVGIFDGVANVSVSIEADGRIVAGISLAGEIRKEAEGEFLMGDKLISREVTPTGVLLIVKQLLATSNTCSHSPCEVGKPGLALGCDPCVTSYCNTANPDCCDPTKTWTSVCATGFSNYCHRRCDCEYCTPTPAGNPWPMDPGACPPYTSSICSSWEAQCCDLSWDSTCVDQMKTHFHKCR
jgi:hypothetical protein